MCAAHNTLGMVTNSDRLRADPRGELLRFLRFSRDAADFDKGFEYSSIYDFVLRHGRFFQSKALPARMWTGEMGRCYGNSIILGVKENLRYVEGFAVSHQGFPIHHAWNSPAPTPGPALINNTHGTLQAGAEPLALDATWEPPALAYFGVEFSIGRADDATWNGDASVLDDWQRRFPLFRDPWPGEDWSKVWEQSPVMKEIEASVKHFRTPSDAQRIASRLKHILSKSETFHVVAVVSDASPEDVQEIRRYLTLKENARLNLKVSE